MANEREILRLEAEKLEQDGYTVLLEPSPSVLPAVLKGLRPDAIAVGKEPHLLVEVIAGDPDSSARVRKIRDVISGVPDWKLHVVYIGASSSTDLPPLLLEDIKKTIDQVPSVAAEDTRAGLIVCWASLEALARALQPGTFRRPQSPGRIVEQLAGIAYVPASGAEFLRKMAAKRNEFVHGQLQTKVDLKDIEKFVAVLQSLVEEAQAENVP